MTIQHWEWALFVLGQSHYFIGRVHIVQPKHSGLIQRDRQMDRGIKGTAKGEESIPVKRKQAMSRNPLHPPPMSFPETTRL